MTMGSNNSKAESDLQAFSKPSHSSGGRSSGKKQLKRHSHISNMSVLESADLQHLAAASSQTQCRFTRSCNIDESQSATKTVSSQGTASPDFSSAPDRRSKLSLASQVRSSIGWLYRPPNQEAAPPHVLLIPPETETNAPLPPRTRPIPLGSGGRHEHAEDEEDMANLKRMYDASTWNMWYRITESRKQSNYKYESNHQSASDPHEVTEPSEVEEDPDDEHELIFGDLED